MSSQPSFLHRAPRLLAIFALQALLWLVITLVFATLVQAAGWARWNDALYFSATNWLPWAAIAPVVFWLARRFPFERRQLLRSVPIHLIGCASCVVLLMWISAFFVPLRRPSSSRSSGESRDRSSETRFGERRSSETPPPPTVTTEPTATLGVTAERAPSTEGAPTTERPVSTERAPLDRAAAAKASAERRERWAKARAAAAERNKDGSRRSGERSKMSGPFPRPPSSQPSTVPGMIRRWAFLSNFWPPFSSPMLRANFGIALYMIITCVAHALGYYRRAQDRERQALALVAGLHQAKLDALRLQLQPHFLFNTLNAISALVHRDPRAADEVITDLGELLRLSLQSAENEVPLSRELELLESYLAIERTRLGHRLRIERHIDPALLGAMVPTLILQPLAENAIRHGIEPRMAPGTVTIAARRLGDAIEIVVGDDGVGLKPAAIGTSRRGIGLANAEERLRTLHGEKGRLTLLSPEAGGVQVQLVFPFRLQPAAPAATA